MQFLIILLLYQTVSARFAWLDTRLSSNPQTMDDVSQAMDELFTDILNDMKLDISFDFPQTSIFNNNMNINTKDDLFSTPPFFQSNTQNTNNFQSKPLFLMIDTRKNKPINQNQFKNPPLFTLQQTNKVNGNTWRYSVTTNGNNRIITESWSTPKMYLCNSRSCGSDSGIEMVDIINNFEQKNSQKYMHLVPVTTMQSMDNNMEMDMDMNMEMGNDENNNNWMDYTKNMVKGCHKKMRNWYYGNDNENMDMENNNEDIIIIDNDEIFDEDIRDETIDKDKNDDILVVGMCIVMVLIIVCGVLYAGWKYMIEKKERSKMDYYVAMHETDAF